NQTITNLTWSVVSGPADITGPTTCGVGCMALTTTARLTNGAGTATLRLTVRDEGSCTNNFTRDDVVLTVNPLPDCTISGADSVFVGSKNNPYSATSGAGLTYSWSLVSPIVSGVTFNGSTSGSSVKVDVASGIDNIANPSFT